MIEKGRHYNIPREDRICPNCSLKEIEDEMHFLLCCPCHNLSRINLLSTISMNCHLFNNMCKFDQFLWLMNCEDIDVLCKLCEILSQKFVHVSVISFKVYLQILLLDFTCL